MSYLSEGNERTLGGTAAGLGSFALFWFLGATAFAPLVIGFVAFFVLLEFSSHSPAINVVLAALCAQTGWFALGVLIMPSLLSQVALDIIFNVILITWVLIRPNMIVLGLAFLGQLAGLIVNVYVLTTASTMQQGKALIAHVLLRGLILAAVSMAAYQRMRPEAFEAAEDVPA